MTDSPGSSNNLSQSGTGVQSAGSGLDALERHLASLHDQVRKLQRLASLGTMSAMLAHESSGSLCVAVAADSCGKGGSRTEFVAVELAPPSKVKSQKIA